MIEVVVKGEPSRAEQLKRSAEAVDVVDARPSQSRALSVGDLLARTQGVAVRRNGGVGSEASLSLNGLYDRQVPVFVDGVPIDIAGFPQGIANVPAALVERIELYRGVVPVRFGAEALGGVVHVVTASDDYRTGGSASIERGSFGLYRGSAVGRLADPSTGLTGQVVAYADRATNRYDIVVDAPDALGRNVQAVVPRFHDAYAARGVSLEGGFVQRPWAKRLLVRLSYNGFDKEVQHNIIQTVPYGEVTSGETTFTGLARYEQPELFGRGTSLEMVGATARRVIRFRDASPFIYDWFGRRVGVRARSGESDSVARDSTIGETTLFARTVASYRPNDSHELRLSLGARSTARHGDDPLNEGPDKVELADARVDLVTFAAGLEHVLRASRGRIENIAAIKAFAFDASFDEPLRGDRRRKSDADDETLGFSDALLFRVAKPLAIKASFEHATRFPHPDEIFGDGALIRQNSDLKPEVSDNLNVGVEFKARAPRIIAVTGGAGAFFRLTDRQILLQGNGGAFQYQNLLRARTVGADAYARTSLVEGLMLLDANATLQDLRNTSDEGNFAQHEGERLPNRPHAFANATLTLQLRDSLMHGDVLSLGTDMRYVGAFLVGWGSRGDPATKLTVPSQLVASAFASWSISREWRFTSTLEVQNIGDARVFDNFGVQKPGRSTFIKLVAAY